MRLGCSTNVARAGMALAFLWALAWGPAFGAEEGEEAHVPYPLEHWAMRGVMRNVALSPDGTRLALMQIPSGMATQSSRCTTLPISPRSPFV